MLTHTIIEPLTSIWWTGLLTSILIIIFLVFGFKNTSLKVREISLKFFSIILFSVFIITTIIAIMGGDWSIQQNLPLHLCRISFFICIILLWNKKQWMYEWVLYLAIPSGLHSMLTPELTMGISIWYLFDYYLVHSALIFVPLYLTVVMGFKTRKDAWKTTFLRLQIAVAFIFPLNFIINSNYMYLKAKPIVENPLLIGDWPYYIFFLEFVVLIHIVLIHAITPKQ
jgi:hypothetical integral membrane protein (TIGR02206 family)